MSGRAPGPPVEVGRERGAARRGARRAAAGGPRPPSRAGTPARARPPAHRGRRARDRRHDVERRRLRRGRSPRPVPAAAALRTDVPAAPGSALAVPSPHAMPTPAAHTAAWAPVRRRTVARRVPRGHRVARVGLRTPEGTTNLLEVIGRRTRRARPALGARPPRRAAQRHDRLGPTLRARRDHDGPHAPVCRPRRAHGDAHARRRDGPARACRRRARRRRHPDRPLLRAQPPAPRTAARPTGRSRSARARGRPTSPTGRRAATSASTARTGPTSSPAGSPTAASGCATRTSVAWPA